MSDLAVPGSRGVRELRLALVCYGGVSLAIYMHGITKEIQRLVVASAAFEQSPDSNPFPEGRSEHAYWELLRLLDERGPEARRGIPTRVVVDIISGTSAGGINGICLAKALATNRWQDALKDVWFDRGDITTLLHGPTWLPSIARFPVVALTSLVLRRPPSFLRGDDMSAWLLGALRAMDAGDQAIPGRDSLVPTDDPSLQLFVPVTDFRGFRRTIALDDPKLLHDVAHRYVLGFDYAALGPEGFAGAGNHALAFAARATSSFPGAFSAVSVDDYARSVGGDGQVRDVIVSLFDEYRAMHQDPTAAWFVDGGVLDNLPFESTIAAIGARPASTEVDRRLLFIDPNPALIPETGADASAKADTTAPSWLSTALNSIATIPRAEPVIDSLHRIAERNETVMRIREIIETSFDDVTAVLSDRTADTLGWRDTDAWPDNPSLDEVRGWRTALEDAAAAQVGLSYVAYLRLRISAVLDSYARQIVEILGVPPTSDEAALVRTVLRQRARDTGLLRRRSDATDGQRAFLTAYDLSYHERALRFLIAAFNWWYRDQDDPRVPPRDDLDTLKRQVYGLIVDLRKVGARLRDDEELTRAVRRAFDPDATASVVSSRDVERIAAFTADRSELLDTAQERVGVAIADAVATMERALYGALERRVGAWSTRARRDLLVRYLGFPFWDILVHPVQTLSDVGERDHVEVSRISPLDVTMLTTDQPPRAPLAGVALHHFGAFFDRAGREHDYLWGRLDAAERLVTLLFDDPYDPGLQPPEPEHCARVFQAIVDEERAQGLRHEAALDDVQQRITRLSPHPVPPADPLVPTE